MEPSHNGANDLVGGISVYLAAQALDIHVDASGQ
jgi:hypothetical protein